MADPMPRHADAMKATLSGDVFDDPDWIVERKLDGVRCLAFRDGGSVTLESRNRLSLNERYAEVAATLDDQACERFVVDGEVVGISGGRSSFEALQRRGHDRRVKIAFYVFDVLWLDGDDLRERPLRERKAALRDALRFGGGTVRWTPYRRAHEGERLLAEACRSGWEGLIAKRADSPYTRQALARLAEVEVLGRAGARHRRLHRARAARARTSARCSSATTTATCCATRARSAPASTRTSCAPSGSAWPRSSAPTPPSAPASRPRAAPPGWRPSSSPRCLQRMDARRAPAPPALPGPARRQVRA